MEPGDLIQTRYELTGRLGQGGMAEVWLARDGHLNRDVAVKFLAPQLSEDPEFLVRFFSEAQEVARISHPNVVQVLDFGEFEDSPYLVMEAVTGGPLTDRTGEPHEPDWAFEIVSGAARAAGAAHDLGIIHRDIKPANILLDEDGIAKLADFGIASSGRSERLTATGAAVGSPHYISPEQASGVGASPASDVYALGIVLYELLTGARPFEGNNITAIAIAHVEQDPAPPSTHVPDLDADIDAVVLRCLAKDPDARFADGTELAAALERFDAIEPIPAPTAIVGTELPWWTNRRVLVGGAVAAALIAAPVLAALVSGDGPVASASGKEARLPNVGGLRLKESPSPSVTPDGSGLATPHPSPTKRAERVAADAERRSDDANAGPDPAEEEPDPTPAPTEGGTDPTPEPTPEGTPAP